MSLSHSMQFIKICLIFADRNDDDDKLECRLKGHSQGTQTSECGNGHSGRPLDAGSGTAATGRASRLRASTGAGNRRGASGRGLAGGCGKACLCDAGNATGEALIEGLAKLELVGLKGFEAAGDSDGDEKVGAGDGGHGAGSDTSGWGASATSAPRAVGSVAGDDAALLEGAVG